MYQNHNTLNNVILVGQWNNVFVFSYWELFLETKNFSRRPHLHTITYAYTKNHNLSIFQSSKYPLITTTSRNKLSACKTTSIQNTVHYKIIRVKNATVFASWDHRKSLPESRDHKTSELNLDEAEFLNVYLFFKVINVQSRAKRWTDWFHYKYFV